MQKPWEIIKQFNHLVFSIQLVGHVQCEPDWYRSPRRYHTHTVWMISKGHGEFIIDGKAYHAEPGNLFIIVPGMEVERTSDAMEPLEFYFSRFSYAKVFLENEAWQFQDGAELTFPLSGMIQLQNPPVILNLFDRLNNLWKRRGPTITQRRSITFHELWLAVANDIRSQKVTGSTSLAIEATIDYIVSQYKKKLTLEELASMAGLSVSHYSRLFKKYTGHSPIDYLNHLRMDRAKELLILSDYRLKAIARSVGYEDEFYFSRIFKKMEGKSPSEYASKYKSTQQQTK